MSWPAAVLEARRCSQVEPHLLRVFKSYPSFALRVIRSAFADAPLRSRCAALDNLRCVLLLVLQQLCFFPHRILVLVRIGSPGANVLGFLIRLLATSPSHRNAFTKSNQSNLCHKFIDTHRRLAADSTSSSSKLPQHSPYLALHSVLQVLSSMGGHEHQPARVGYRSSSYTVLQVASAAAAGGRVSGDKAPYKPRRAIGYRCVCSAKNLP